MKLHEALSKSNKVKRKLWMGWSYFDYTTGVVHIAEGDDTRLYTGDYQADDWEPILEKKKMYQALFKYSCRIHVSSELYKDEKEAQESLKKQFVKLLTDRPIEVEATDESNV